MKPFYWQGTTNFGDYMNKWLWPQLLDDCLCQDDNIRLIGIGSLLKSSLNYLHGTKIIFGTGSGYGAIPSSSMFKDWKFYFVRGPLTAKCFNLPPQKAIVDGAWLISQVEQYSTIPEKEGVSFVPHWTTAQHGNWQKVCKIAGIKFIDPMGDLHHVLKEISKSTLVITESLHGAIMADYFRSPWIPVSISPKFLPFKWVDWFNSVELEGKMCTLPLSDTFDYIYCGKSRRNVCYDSILREIQFQKIVHDSCQGKGCKVTNAYRVKTALKIRARRYRGIIFDKVLSLRQNPLVNSWDNCHQEKIAKMLLNLASGDTFLSTEAVRIRKVQQLADVLGRLRSDYAKGVFNS